MEGGSDSGSDNDNKSPSKNDIGENKNGQRHFANKGRVADLKSQNKRQQKEAKKKIKLKKRKGLA